MSAKEPMMCEGLVQVRPQEVVFSRPLDLYVRPGGIGAPAGLRSSGATYKACQEAPLSALRWAKPKSVIKSRVESSGDTANPSAVSPYDQPRAPPSPDQPVWTLALLTVRRTLCQLPPPVLLR